MAKREPSTRSIMSTMTTSPPPTYTPGGDGRPGHVQYPSFASSSGSSGGINPYDPYATTTGERRMPSDASDADVQRERLADGTAPRGNRPPSIIGGDTASIAQYSMAGSTAGSDVRTEIVGFNRGGDRNITNYINISRKATPHPRIFSLFYPNPKIIETFHIDPHLRVPGGVLSAVQARSTHGNTPARRAEQRKEHRHGKNLSLALEDGKMDATIYLIADCDPCSSSSRRLRSRASLASEISSLQRKTTVQRTTIIASLNTTRPKTFKAYPMFLRIHAPQPRPPFHLQATCTGPSLKAVSRSPVTLFLPYSFHGPITLRIQVGNIDHHLWLSPTVMAIARMMSEDDQSRGYFLGALPDLDEEDEDESPEEDAQPSGATRDWAKRDEEWQGDKAEIDIGNGRLRILFEDERLEGMAETSSNGWIWPAKWG